MPKLSAAPRLVVERANEPGMGWDSNVGNFPLPGDWLRRYHTVSMLGDAASVESRVTTGAPCATASAAMRRSCISGISVNSAKSSNCGRPNSESSMPSTDRNSSQQPRRRARIAQLGRKEMQLRHHDRRNHQGRIAGFPQSKHRLCSRRQPPRGRQIHHHKGVGVQHEPQSIARSSLRFARLAPGIWGSRYLSTPGISSYGTSGRSDQIPLMLLSDCLSEGF